MSIVTKSFYAVKCDGCGKLYPPESEFEEYTYWDDSNFAIQCAIEGDWLVDKQGDGYCTACYEYDDDDNLILKKKEVTNEP
jgi:ribosomal protein S27E